MGFPKIVEERKPFVCCKMLGFLEALSISSAGAFSSFVCLFKWIKRSQEFLLQYGGLFLDISLPLDFFHSQGTNFLWLDCNEQ